MSYQGKTEQISPHYYSCDANGGIVDAHIPRWKAEEIAAEADEEIARLKAENERLRDQIADWMKANGPGGWIDYLRFWPWLADEALDAAIDAARKTGEQQ